MIMAVDVIKVDPERPDREHIHEAARVLARGGILAMPTETVYGLAADQKQARAMARLMALKQRPPDKAFSVHIADMSDLSVHVSPIPRRVRNLVDRYWPGPLTLVFDNPDLERGHGMGVRFPAHQVARDVIRVSGKHIVMPSANPAGRAPALTAQEVIDYFPSGIDLVIDAGPATIQEASTVVKVTRTGWQLLREGLVSGDMLRTFLNITILFVCTGNSCRSPLAEALCKKELARACDVAVDALPDYGYTVLSAGTDAVYGVPASPYSVQVAASMGADYLRKHGSRLVTPALLGRCDYIFAMEKRHLQIMEEWLPEGLVAELLDPQGLDIPDPIGGDEMHYRECAFHILSCLKKVIPGILEDVQSGSS